MTHPTKIEARKKQILKAAESVFAKRGFQQATISEIAKQAKVSEASIYEHFSTKEGLLFSIPEETAKQVFGLMDFHLELIRGAANKLRAIIYIMLSSYQKNPDFTSVLMLLLKHDRKFLETPGYQAIRNGLKKISIVLKEGIASGEFRSDLNIYLVRSMIIGTVEHLVTNWVMKGNPEKLSDFVDPLIDTIIEGIRYIDPQSQSPHWSLQKIPAPSAPPSDKLEGLKKR